MVRQFATLSLGAERKRELGERSRGAGALGMNRRIKSEPSAGDSGGKRVGSTSDKANPRAERLAAELRSNLKKRKDQERARTRADRDRPD